MKSNYYAVIMAGGIGSRFWPVSTTQLPKQFHDMLGSGETLLQRTFSRLRKIIPAENILILTNERYLDLCLLQLPEITEAQIVLEPAMRNTAPCILLSALKIYKKDPKALMLVAPSDHWIEDEASFQKDVEFCFEQCAAQNILVTLGIQPSFPNTGYGYIEASKSETSGLEQVLQFREKPDYETAKEFLNAGNFFWNAGIFLWSAQSIVSAYEKLMPQMYDLFNQGSALFNTLEEQTFIEKNYQQAENISIDYGILEKADNVYFKKAGFDWNDLGTWGALHEKLDKDPFQNAVVRALPNMENASGNMIFSSKEKLVVVDGINDYIIVDNENVLLIFPKEKEQDIKTLLGKIVDKFGKKYS